MILNYARVQGWRTGENPARWKGHLEHILPAKTKVQKVEHHAALPWKEMPAFMRELSQRDVTAALALQFTILTASRTGEVIGARWSEIDLESRVWTIPAERMKAAKEHRVPLSEPALAVLEAMKARRLPRHQDWIFFGRRDQPISNMTMLMALRKNGHPELTTHGFRSTFRDWCADHGKPADLAEAALAHLAGDKTVLAYQRGDLLERRRVLMEEWAAFAMSGCPSSGSRG